MLQDVEGTRIACRIGEAASPLEITGKRKRAKGYYWRTQ